MKYVSTRGTAPAISFEDVLLYCRRSANPVGRLMLRLYGADVDMHDLANAAAGWMQ